MIDLRPLMRCLPVCDLEAFTLGFVSGWHDPSATTKYTQPNICWTEPPAGVRQPYVNPVKATAILLRHQGHEHDNALAVAQTHYAALRSTLQVIERIRYLDEFEPNSPEHIPGDRWLDHLQAQACVPQDVLDFLRQTLQVCAECTTYAHPDFVGRSLSLLDLPMQPPANSLIQFQPGCPWGEEADKQAGMVNGASFDNWMQWRERMRVHAANIEALWGESPLYLANPDDDLGDDLMHRFLVLHWCCSCKPDAPYVQFLLEASGASSVEQLKTALLNPENYAQPYAIQNVFGKMEPRACRFSHVSPSQKTPFVTIAFEDPSCLQTAVDLVHQQVGADVLLIDPNGHLDRHRLADLERYARHVVQQLNWRECLDAPFETLARTDVLHVLEGPGSTSGRTDVSAPLLQMIGLADALKVQTHFHVHERGTLWNFMDRPGFRQASAAAQAWLLAQPAHLPDMDEIHVWCDFAASGLWDKRGNMLGYDVKTLPWDLIRRLSAWQWDYDCTIDPPEHMGSNSWWAEYTTQTRALAREVQQAVGPQVRVMVDAEGGPVWIGSIAIETNGVLK